MPAILAGTKPFSHLTDFHEIQQYAELCLSRNSEDRPAIARTVEFLWEQTNVAETVKTMLSKFAVQQISKASLTNIDYHADGEDILGAALICKCVYKTETEVSVFVRIHGIAHNTSVKRSRSRL